MLCALIRLLSLSTLSGIAIRLAFRSHPVEAGISVLKGRYREMASFLVQTSLNATLKLFGRNIDVLILGTFRDSAEVGLYRIGKDFVGFLHRLTSSMTGPATAEIGKLWAQSDIVAFRSFVKRLTGILAALLIPATLAVVAGCELLIQVTVGPEFVGAAAAVRIMVWGTLVYGIFSWAGNALTVMGRPGIVTMSTAARNCVLIAVSLLAVPRFGFMGAACAMTISDLAGRVSLWLFYALSKRRQPTPRSPSGET